MDVMVRIERDQPPAGTVVPLLDSGPPAPSDATALAFDGWLGLLRALAEVLERAETAEPASR